jgi:3,4-dihydroxy 2-butanone 4-phosphate synthase/GTP cyclohydrolase II
MSAPRFSPIKDAVADIRKGRMLVVVDDPSRENEGDLVMAADKVTPHSVNFMACHGRGLICVPMLGDALDRLNLRPMVEGSVPGPGRDTAFTVSVDAARGTTTGISAKDRSITVKRLIDPRSAPDDLHRPGHIFPLRAKEGGVLERAGHTEAAVDLARMAGLKPAGLICEIMDEDGTMARMPELSRFSRRHGLKMITIQALIEYRRAHERLIERLASARLPTPFGEFTLHVYQETLTGRQHLAMSMGGPGEGALVRVHSSCLTGDTLFSQRCDCGLQLEAALRMIAKEGRGVLVYLAQEGRGIGLVNKMRAYALQDRGLDTVEANLALGLKPDLREYGIGAQILSDLGLRRIRLITNNPRKLVGLAGFGLKVVGRVPIVMHATPHSARYLRTKREKLGHLMELGPVLHTHFSLVKT